MTRNSNNHMLACFAGYAGATGLLLWLFGFGFGPLLALAAALVVSEFSLNQLDAAGPETA